MKVDLKVVEPDQFGNVLQHFTGSKAHNVALREAAVRRGLHVSEYGILDDATGETLRCATEEEVYETLGLRVDPAGAARGPRRARGRRAGGPGLPRADHARRHARRPALPHDAVRRPPDARGDGRGRARPRGYEYLAITDHSASHGFGDHVTPEALAERIERDPRARTRRWTASSCWPAPRSTSSPTASLDYDDELLAKLDWVIASVHTSFSMGEQEMTDRMIARDRAPAGRRDRPPDGPQDRDARRPTRSTSSA